MSAAAWRRREGRPPFVFGHRGVRGALPENTMAAFERARAEGADGIELDVRLAATGEVVVAHDPDLKRVTGGADPRKVADLPWEELRRVDVGGGEPPPRLSEVLAWAHGAKMRVNVELKHDEPRRAELARNVARLVQHAPAASTAILVSSFDPWLVALFRAMRTGIPTAFIFHAGQRKWRPWLWARALGVDAAHPERTLVSREAVAAAKRAGLVVNVWTVNDAREAVDLAAIGVDGLITDRPGEVVEITRKRSDAARAIS